MKETIAYIGLGGNLGNPDATCRAATVTLAESSDVVLLRSSALYRTQPVDAPGPDYCNGVLEIRTQLSALSLLELLLQTEQTFGRSRTAWHAPRTLDLDLIAFGDSRIISAQLSLPHPRAHERAFVLIPLCEVNPEVMLGGPDAVSLRPARIWRDQLSAAESNQVIAW
ncbi:MAG: 2-amino-4-hydroxy-6-hydroxymethyldihydropteridine diphosphokinase [Burkholderiaceae bacterium]|nr:2-amino-4-hydroxy-6-hydroxymethyldihydropteridine diphosphokinase [Burkholderiaceae bacterium]